MLDLHHRLQRTHGLSQRAYSQLDLAERRTTWGRRHRQRFALLDDAEVLASATRYDHAGVLDQKPIRLSAMGRRDRGSPARLRRSCARADREARARGHENGADVALLLADGDALKATPHGFEPIRMTELTLGIVQSPRHGAPMVLIRGGEARDFQAIAHCARTGPAATDHAGMLPSGFMPPQVTIL